jgi:hypothetical protein
VYKICIVVLQRSLCYRGRSLGSLFIVRFVSFYFLSFFFFVIPFYLPSVLLVHSATCVKTCIQWHAEECSVALLCNYGRDYWYFSLVNIARRFITNRICRILLFEELRDAWVALCINRLHTDVTRMPPHRVKYVYTPSGNRNSAKIISTFDS